MPSTAHETSDWLWSVAIEARAWGRACSSDRVLGRPQEATPAQVAVASVMSCLQHHGDSASTQPPSTSTARAHVNASWQGVGRHLSDGRAYANATAGQAADCPREVRQHLAAIPQPSVAWARAHLAAAYRLHKVGHFRASLAVAADMLATLRASMLASATAASVAAAATGDTGTAGTAVDGEPATANATSPRKPAQTLPKHARQHMRLVGELRTSERAALTALAIAVLRMVAKVCSPVQVTDPHLASHPSLLFLCRDSALHDLASAVFHSGVLDVMVLAATPTQQAAVVLLQEETRAHVSMAASGASTSTSAGARLSPSSLRPLGGEGATGGLMWGAAASGSAVLDDPRLRCASHLMGMYTGLLHQQYLAQGQRKGSKGNAAAGIGRASTPQGGQYNRHSHALGSSRGAAPCTVMLAAGLLASAQLCLLGVSPLSMTRLAAAVTEGEVEAFVLLGGVSVVRQASKHGLTDHVRTSFERQARPRDGAAAAGHNHSHRSHHHTTAQAMLVGQHSVANHSHCQLPVLPTQRRRPRLVSATSTTSADSVEEVGTAAAVAAGGGPTAALLFSTAERERALNKVLAALARADVVAAFSYSSKEGSTAPPLLREDYRVIRAKTLYALGMELLSRHTAATEHTWDCGSSESDSEPESHNDTPAAGTSVGGASASSADAAAAMLRRRRRRRQQQQRSAYQVAEATAFEAVALLTGPIEEFRTSANGGCDDAAAVPGAGGPLQAVPDSPHHAHTASKDSTATNGTTATEGARALHGDSLAVSVLASELGCGLLSLLARALLRRSSFAAAVRTMETTLMVLACRGAAYSARVRALHRR